MGRVFGDSFTQVVDHALGSRAAPSTWGSEEGEGRRGRREKREKEEGRGRREEGGGSLISDVEHVTVMGRVFGDSFAQVVDHALGSRAAPSTWGSEGGGRGREGRERRERKEEGMGGYSPMWST
jgi:hypothetical protein